MRYPTLPTKNSERQMVDTFKGYNHNLRIGDGEFFDMKNMISDHYPVLCPRESRGVYRDTKANGLIAKDKLCYVDGTDFVLGDVCINLELSDGPKDLISIGAYVIIMPDRKCINTVNLRDEDHDIDAVYETDGTEDETIATFATCDQTGAEYDFDKMVFNESPPVDTDGHYETDKLWIDTSSKPYMLKKYSYTSGTWVSPTTYIKISSPGIGKKFKQYEGVEISGVVIDALKDSLNGYQTLWGCGDDYIIVEGFCDGVWNQYGYQGTITVARRMPDMDFIIESNNRLWGCKYGVNADGEMVNEIYASKLGDFRNWNCFMGLSTDSYRASCGSDGPFTGAITHLGYPLFFKENCIHKVYGNVPANFRIQVTDCRGVQEGSQKSLAIVGETVLYKSRNAVCAYDGSLPVEISSALGNVHYNRAVAGVIGNKYYIDMRTPDGTFHLFVYDTAKGLWHKEDNIRVDAFCAYGNELYGIDHETKNIITMLGSGTKDNNNVPWMVETGLWGMSMPDMKYISGLQIRMSLEAGANVAVSIQYDSMGDWEQVCQVTMTSLRSFAIPIRPRRCDHFRIRIEGEGQGRIYSITKTIEQGSDIS